MAHPHRNEAKDGHNAKLKRMTDGYGLASGPANNIDAPPERYKGEGPEDAIGFGANSEQPRGRSDRANRKQLVANPVATLKHGGHPKHRKYGGRAEGGPAGALLSESRGLAPISQRARGGRKGHGKTQVNVLVAPQHGGAGASGGAPVVPVPPVAGGLPPAALPARPAGPPMGAGPMVPPAPMPGPMAPGAPGGIPPGVLPPRKHGGRVHSDEAEDKALIEKSLKKHHLVRKDGGSIGGSASGDEMMAHSRKEQGLKAPVVASEGEGHKPKGRHMPHLSGGSVSGVGRLEKTEWMRKHPDRRTQEV